MKPGKAPSRKTPLKASSVTVDHARRGRAAKRKGERGEIEVRDILRDHGYADAHRQFQSGGQGGGDLADAIPDVHLEVKRTESIVLGTWWRQATRDARPTDLVLVVHRGNDQPWQATGLLADLYVMLEWLPMAPVVIGPRSPRPVFLAEHKLTLPTRRPMVLHQCAGSAMCTVLFEDFLEAYREVVDERSAA